MRFSRGFCGSRAARGPGKPPILGALGRWGATIPLKFPVSSFAQTVTGDLDISSGNLQVETNIAQCTAWKLANLFGLFKGEWFRDQRLGVPYFQYVLVSNPNMGLIGSIFREVALDAPGVASVTDLQLDYTPRARTLDVSLSVQTNEGVILVGGVGKPFIIQPQAGG